MSAARLLPPTDVKRFASLQASAALAEVLVVLTEDDNGRPAFIVSRWSLTRQVSGLDELAHLLQRMGVRG